MRAKRRPSVSGENKGRGASNGEVKMPPDVVACRVVLDPLDKKDDSALCATTSSTASEKCGGQ